VLKTNGLYLPKECKMLQNKLTNQPFINTNIPQSGIRYKYHDSNYIIEILVWFQLIVKLSNKYIKKGVLGCGWTGRSVYTVRDRQP
jgi:hypothetical protein